MGIIELYSSEQKESDKAKKIWNSVIKICIHSRVVNRAGLFGSGSGSGRVRAGFGPGLALISRKTSGFFRARYDAFKKTKLFCYLIFILCTLT